MVLLHLAGSQPITYTWFDWLVDFIHHSAISAYMVLRSLYIFQFLPYSHGIFQGFLFQLWDADHLVERCSWSGCSYFWCISWQRRGTNSPSCHKGFQVPWCPRHSGSQHIHLARWFWGRSFARVQCLSSFLKWESYAKPGKTAQGGTWYRGCI